MSFQSCVHFFTSCVLDIGLSCDNSLVFSYYLSTGPTADPAPELERPAAVPASELPVEVTEATEAGGVPMDTMEPGK